MLRFAAFDVDAAGVSTGVVPCYWTWVSWVSAGARWSLVLRVNGESAFAWPVSPVAADVSSLVSFTLWAIVVDWLHVVPPAGVAVAGMSRAVFPFTDMACWTAQSAGWWSGGIVRNGILRGCARGGVCGVVTAVDVVF